MPDRKTLADAIRVLAMDAVEQAASGHPGAPMGMADMAEALWNGFLRHNPANPQWVDRDRFVLSNGHASMLLYAVLHLTGYDLGIDDIRDFRQLGSRTPGHPETGITPGVDASTGPLGQGIAMAVGMALAEKMMAARFNRDGFSVVDHYTYVFLGEGCLMEGVSSEACSLAGTFGLGKLIALFDQNGISIDGEVDGWFSEDVAARYRAYGWHVIDGVDGHDGEAVAAAIQAARAVTDKPSLICCRTVIGQGSPSKAGTSACHGSPLGAEDVAGVRKALGWPHEPFSIPAEIKEGWDARAKGAALEAAWNDMFAAYAAAYPDLASEFTRRMRGNLPADWNALADACIRELQAQHKPMATRAASGDVLNRLAGDHLPDLIGGSADLTSSVNTRWKGAKLVTRDAMDGEYIAYGVREFAMACMMNGMALHGGFIPYAGTFLVFSDYARSALRLAALMRTRVIHVLTHDSIGVGEDGPTHQPVEQTPSLRLIPGLDVWRPADAAETAVAWKESVNKQGPSCIICSRQSLPAYDRDQAALEAVSRGGYVLRDCAGTPQAIIIATGSEVAEAVASAEKLEGEGIRVRVVSMPCVERFLEQDAAWKEAVLPSAVTARLAVEAASPDGWYRFVGLDGDVIGMTGFGESAPGPVLAVHFGFTADKVADAVRRLLDR